MRSAIATWLLLAAAALVAVGQPAAPKLPPAATENDAISLALMDCQKLPPDVALTTRYLWCPDADPESAKAASAWLNSISRASVIRRPEFISLGRILLVRVDLRLFAPRAKDLEEWLDLWESFRFEPRLHRLITPDTLTPVREKKAKGKKKAVDADVKVFRFSSNR